MEFLPVDFEPSMLNFYKSKSVVQTASVGQVRANFNDKSIGSTKDIPEVFEAFK
jgi:hypothetical protein